VMHAVDMTAIQPCYWAARIFPKLKILVGALLLFSA